MFANTFSSRQQRGAFPSDLYQQVSIETRLAGADPHALVAMLFEGWMQAVAQARGAIRNRDLVGKGQAISRAVRIIDEGLRAGLDMRAGGTLARDLHDLYGYLTLRLTVANLHNDESALDECQRLMKPLQDAWLAISPDVASRP
jgi:flagellar secretion chaperone FliS